MDANNVNRRDFLKGATLGALGLTFGIEEIDAYAEEQGAGKPGQSQPPNKPAQARQEEQLTGPPVNIAVIGLGARGREILTSLAKVGPVANVTTICDTFEAPVFVKKSTAIV